MEGDEEPETIDVWELMKDLDDDEDSLNSKQPEIEPLSTQATTSAKYTLDSMKLEPSDVKEVPQWLSSYHTQRVLGSSLTSPVSRDFPTYEKLRSKQASAIGSTSHPSDLLNVKLAGPTQETLAEHLQRSLSFETSPKKEMRRIFGKKDAMNAYYNKGLKLGFAEDAPSFSSNQLPGEGESVSSPSTPSFSESVSLKKWFQEDARRSKPKHEHRAAVEESRHAAQSKLPPHQVSHPLRHAWKVPGPTSKVPASSHSIRSNVRSNVDAGAHHKPGSHHVVADQMPYAGLNQTRSELSQQGRFRNLRHSFTAGNRNKEPSEMRNSPANNRSNSLELEKVAVAPKVRVVLYSTSSKEDVHAFEDSNAARAILKSVVGTTFEERSVSEDNEYKQELKRALNTERALVPTVCVQGRYITGLDDIMQMYKQGVLRSLVAESLMMKHNAPCICRGGKFLICPVCKGKRKLARKEGDEDVVCRHCSATGLIKCPNCLNA